MFKIGQRVLYEGEKYEITSTLTMGEITYYYLNNKNFPVNESVLEQLTGTFEEHKQKLNV